MNLLKLDFMVERTYTLKEFFETKVKTMSDAIASYVTKTDNLTTKQHCEKQRRIEIYAKCLGISNKHYNDVFIRSKLTEAHLESILIFLNKIYQQFGFRIYRPTLKKVPKDSIILKFDKMLKSNLSVLYEPKKIPLIPLTNVSCDGSLNSIIKDDVLNEMITKLQNLISN